MDLKSPLDALARMSKILSPLSPGAKTMVINFLAQAIAEEEKSLGSLHSEITADSSAEDSQVPVPTEQGETVVDHSVN